MSTAIRRIWVQRASIVRFLATGVAGAGLNVVLFVVFSPLLGVDYRIAVGLAFALSYLFSFVAHRSWTFSASDGHAGHQGARFVVASAVSIAFALVVAHVAVETFGLPQNAGAAVAGLLTAPVSFLLHRSFTFAGSAPASATPAVAGEPAVPAVLAAPSDDLRRGVT